MLPVNEIKPKSILSDIDIWQFAKSNKYHILTFDEDFAEIQNLHAFPPKIIWLRIGNTSTNHIKFILTEKETEIIDFLNNDELGVFEIYL
ncbi:DUF5615 family PIN-like protein [Mucilaginibacter ximonensis]|uniref:DUF5615 family PIN-like protein n=1 Tax=Mucilaginibacter ximonensis TaxID=538021 RepID=A0ABW5YHA0_9SPHI